MELSARLGRARARRDLHDRSRRAGRRGRGRRGRGPARRTSPGIGEAAPIERYDESAASALAWLESTRTSLGDDPWALDEIDARCRRRVRGARRRRRRAPRPAGQARRRARSARLLGLRRAGPPTSWTVWLGDPDDMARGPRRRARRFRRLKLKLGGRDGLDLERVRAVRAAHRPPAPGRRQRVLVARRGARVPAADAARSTASSRSPRGRPGRARAASARSPVPIYVDEDCHTLADVAPAPSARTGS